MNVSALSFERATGYRVVDRQQLDGARTKAVEVEIPGVGGGRVSLPLAEVDRLFAAYQKLRGPQGAAAVPNGPLADQKSLVDLRADLNVSAFDLSPLVVTDAEAKHALEVLLRATPASFNALLAGLDAAMLDRLLTRIAEAAPFDIDDKGRSALANLATKMALELTPQVGQNLVQRLGDTAKRRLLEGVLQLPTGALVLRLKQSLGDAGFNSLANGGRDQNLVGGGLTSGKVWKENVTPEFQARYAKAGQGLLELPARAKDTVFLMGPGLFGDQLPGYMEPNRKALEAWGVPAANLRKLSYNTAGDPQDNADRIYAQVKQAHSQGKPVVVMGHSKFGRDMLEAFARYPDLKKMITGAVMMQPALAAPIAQDLANPALKGVLDPLLQLVGGERAAFDGMSQKFGDLPPWPSDVPTVVMASSTESSHALLAAAAGPYYRHIYNAASDGAVAFQDQASLEGSYLVTLPGIADHAQPGLCFVDVCEHFAVQIDAGAADDVVKGMLGRLRAMAPQPAVVDALVALWHAGHNTPGERARCTTMLRDMGPALDRIAQVMNRNAGYPLVDNQAMTQALVAELFTRT